MSNETGIKNRYDFALIFDVQDGNPNGDPDAGNLPRLDPENGHGLVTDVCLKRKVRNFVQMAKGLQLPFNIFVQEKAILNNLIDEAHEQDAVKKQTKSVDKTAAAQNWMCSQYFDIRTFGAVMSTGKNAGQVRGPVQFTFGRSIDPIVVLEHSLTVCAARKADKPIEEQIGIQGRKNTVPYGMYVAHGFISPHLAAQTGFSEDDLKLLWQALELMFEHDRSAARGLMSTCKLIIFKHQSPLGDGPAHTQFDRIMIERIDPSKPPRSKKDYSIKLDGAELPSEQVVFIVEAKKSQAAA